MERRPQGSGGQSGDHDRSTDSPSCPSLRSGGQRRTRAEVHTKVHSNVKYTTTRGKQLRNILISAPSSVCELRGKKKKKPY